ncbi:hypothetical protein Salat_0114600 [Sesamum alatum]|uniref:Uncharacterized protein n=1 Tax=Sesamum alatum TaxID=300844 RepID=A0AAE1YY29_9LAMI|nr:hypothetical protein Salat_0114600 [Sesamum alatum]
MAPVALCHEPDVKGCCPPPSDHLIQHHSRRTVLELRRAVGVESNNCFRARLYLNLIFSASTERNAYLSYFKYHVATAAAEIVSLQPTTSLPTTDSGNNLVLLNFQAIEDQQCEHHHHPSALQQQNCGPLYLMAISGYVS